jgi:hypothetical protein
MLSQQHTWTGMVVLANQCHVLHLFLYFLILGLLIIKQIYCKPIAINYKLQQ